MKNSIRLFMFTAILVASSYSCNPVAKLLSSGSPLMSVLGGNTNLSSITSLLQTPGLAKVLGGALKGSFTLLAPTNTALQALGADGIANLTKGGNIAPLANMLKGLIVPGKLDAASILKSGITNAAGKALNLEGGSLGNVLSGGNFNIFPIDKLIN
jgi:uncharacterized surface protein with fasciclin (FAS1) repeats